MKLKKNGIKKASINGYGENILHPNIKEVLEYACKQFDEVSFNTNGLALDLNKVEWLTKLNIKSITFSVTGINSGIYNLFQGSGNKSSSVRDKVYSNILNYIEEKNKNKSKTKVVMQYILTLESKNDLYEYMTFWNDKVDEIRTTYMNDAFELNQCNSQKNKGTLSSCPQIGKNMLIHVNGDVSMCCSDFMRKTAIGNLFQDDLKNILSSNKFIDIIAANKQGRYERLPLICHKCDQLYKETNTDNIFDIITYFKMIKMLDKTKKYAFWGLTLRLKGLLKGINIYDEELDFIIIDSNVHDAYEGIIPHIPRREVLDNRQIIIFAEKQFEKIKKEVYKMNLECKSYKEYLNNSIGMDYK